VVRLPISINPTPLVEAVVDVRFSPLIPPAAVFGFVYGLIKDQYGKISPLPILQLPEQLREQDPNLLFQPHYRMENKPFLLQLGPRIFNLAALDQGYPGWQTFRDEILRLFDIFARNSVIDSVTRIGMRYINYFSFNVFDVSNFSINLEQAPLMNKKTLLRVEFTDGNLVTALLITNGGQVRIGKEAKQGSIIDLDTFCLKPNLQGNKSEEFRLLIEGAHQTLKQRFFSGLKEAYVSSLDHRYE